MSLDWLVIIILAQLLLLPTLGGLLYWLLSRQADNSQDHSPPYNDAQSRQSTPEGRNSAQQTDPPEEPTPDESSPSSSSTPELDGDCERRLRLVRALSFLRGRLEEQGCELNPWERQIIDEATRLLSGGDCVNDARLFIYPESYSAPVILDNTYEAEFIRIYERSPATILVHKDDEDFVAVTNRLGDLTKDPRLNENELGGIRWSVTRAQSILTTGAKSLSNESISIPELSGLYFDINTKYQYLRAVAESRQQYFEIRPYYGPRYSADWDQPDPNPSWLHEGTREARRREHGLQQDADTRPPRLVQQTQAAQQYAHHLYTSQPSPSSAPPTVDQQLHQPEAMGYSNPIFAREASPPSPRPHPQPGPQGPSQPPTHTAHPTSTTPAPHSRVSRYTPHIIPHEARQPTSAMPDPTMDIRRPSPPALEGLNRTGRTISFASFMWSASKPPKQRRKQD